MPPVYILWNGGSSYSLGDMGDLERFPSLSSAKAALRSRERHGHWQSQRFNYVSRDPGSWLCPVVDGSQMLVWFHDPREARDPYPDRILSIGPRGGIREESC